MGFLSSSEVVECSSSDLVGQYVGQTGPKTKQMFDKALGRVLFIDEAYRLAEGHFAKEAMDEIVGLLTQEQYRSKLIVVLAGYDKEMNGLLAVNSGLSSRFPTEITFENFPALKCLEIVRKKLGKESVIVDALENPTAMASQHAHMLHIMEELSTLPRWGNARDCDTLSKQLLGIAFLKPPSETVTDSITLQADEVIICMEEMLSRHHEREKNVPQSLRDMDILRTQMPPSTTPLHTLSKSSTQEDRSSTPTQTLDHSHNPSAEQVDSPVDALKQARDSGVSDLIWEKLQHDRVIAAEATKQRDQKLRQLEEDEKKVQAQLKYMEEMQKRALSQAAHDKLMQEREAARLHRIQLERALQELQEKKKEEERVRRKLQMIGRCQAGFEWIKQEHGYRCAGGSHFVSNEALEGTN